MDTNKKLSEELEWRGFVNQTTLEDLSVLDDQKFVFYWGVDPSAKSMHVGQLAMAIMIRHFINHGHKAVLLVGGATGLIGDPDGKDSERDIKSIDEINDNKIGIAEQYKKLFSGFEFEIVDNYDWFKDIKYIDFLRDVGKHFSMTQLLDRDFVKKRVGQGGSGISYAEFSYSLIQGYDFWHLFKQKGVTLQIAGADQWGNSISGAQLIRKVEAVDAHIFTAPLVINKTTGIKFGKSESGAVWLDENLTSPYQFYQFWLNTGDADVVDYLKIFTLLGQEEVNSLADQMVTDPGSRLAQKRLAKEVTGIVHGSERADKIEKLTESLFVAGDISNLSQEDLSILKGEIPTVKLGINLVEALVQSSLVASNTAARQLISTGSIYVNGQRATQDVMLNSPSLIKKGKNSFLLAVE